MTSQGSVDGFKRVAALAAVELVESGMVVGLGTGSTVRHAIVEIGRRLRDGELERVAGVPTSTATEELAAGEGIPLVALGAVRLDVAIDGADEIAPDLALTKGGGGALLREKIVAAATSRFVVVADESKLVPRLGSTFPVPLEVAAFGIEATLRLLRAHGEPELRHDEEGPLASDNGNRIVDLRLEPFADAAETDRTLAVVPGVLATGIFPGLAVEAFVAGPDGVARLQPRGL